MSKFLVGILALSILTATALPAAATQLGVGLHYLRTLEEYKAAPDFSQDDFALFGSITIPVAVVRVEGQLEWVPNYIGSDEHMFQPAAYGLLELGRIYGGVGIGIGYLTGEDAQGNSFGWATNPFYALRAGIDLGLGGFAVDVFASYRFQSATFGDGVQNIDLDALTLAAQVKFGH